MEFPSITLKQAEKLLSPLLENKIVPFLHSSPALGKSSLAKALAKKMGLKVIDLRLTELDSSDLNGLPYFSDNKAKYLPFDTFPVQGTPIPEGYKGWLLLLDELNSALPSVQAAAYKLILDRQVGQYSLHDNVSIVACGNRDTDNAITYPMSSALVSRFAHFYIDPNTKEWIDWALDNDIDLKVISFLGFKPDRLYTFNPDSTEPYASPRTWEMLSKVLKSLKENGTKIDANIMPLFASLVGHGVALEFLQYLNFEEELPKIGEIIANPKTAEIPKQLGMQWAVVSMVTANMDASNYTQLETYIKRFSMEMGVIALRFVIKQHKDLLPLTKKWRSELASEIF